MPVEQVPGFWDYLGQGIQKGVEMHRQNEAIAREEAHRKTAEAQAQASLIGNLFQSGAVDSSALQGALAGAGIQGAPVIASKAERRRNALAQGPDYIKNLPDEEKKDLGFTSEFQAAQEKAGTAEAGLASKKADLLQRYANGEDLNDQEAAVAGVMTKSDTELKKLNALDPYLGLTGERYIAGQMVGTGGRIDPANAKAVSEQAYTQYVQDRVKNGLGSLSPEQVAYTRQYFDRATENALIAQRKLDLDEYAAKTGRIHAEAARTQSGQNQSLQWFGKVTTAMDNLRKAQSDITKANPAVLVALDNPTLAQSPVVKGALAKYQQLEETIGAFRGAQGSLASGQVPGNLAELLNAADQIAQQGAGGAAGGTGAAAPPPGGRAGGASPAGSGRGAPPAGGASSAADPLAATVNMINSGKAKLSDAQALLKQGTITQAQFDEIKRRTTRK